MKEWVDFGAVKEAVSLEAVLRHYQVPGLRRRRLQLEGCCPIHRGKREDSFRASLAQNAHARSVSFSASPAKRAATFWISSPRWRTAPCATQRSNFKFGFRLRR